MRAITRLSASALIALGVVSLGAHAAEGEAANKVPFEEVDANGDGMITQQEAQSSPLGGAFAQADQNGDGQVDQAEYAAYQLQQTGEGSPDATEVPETGGMTGS